MTLDRNPPDVALQKGVLISKETAHKEEELSQGTDASQQTKCMEALKNGKSARIFFAPYFYPAFSFEFFF
jgi:hypothetical protein